MKSFCFIGLILDRTIAHLQDSKPSIWENDQPNKVCIYSCTIVSLMRDACPCVCVSIHAWCVCHVLPWRKWILNIGVLSLLVHRNTIYVKPESQLISCSLQMFYFFFLCKVCCLETAGTVDLEEWPPLGTDQLQQNLNFSTKIFQLSHPTSFSFFQLIYLVYLIYLVCL